MSKYIGGHSDLIMGALICNEKTLYDQLFYAMKCFGGNPSTFDCYLALRGLKTLEVRMKKHCKNAYCLAKFLSKHKFIEKVIFPGLTEHPGHLISVK